MKWALNPLFSYMKCEVGGYVDKKSWEDAVRKAIEAKGFEVVGIRKESRSKLNIIKIFIDNDTGITLNDCSAVSRLVNDVLFATGAFSNDYRLEVSSPGVNRPLKTVKDFKKNVNRNVRVMVLEKDRHVYYQGTLLSVNDNELVIKDKKNDISIQTSDIIEGKIILPW